MTTDSTPTSSGISPLALAAKRVIDAAWVNGPAYDLASQAAFALESAQLLQSPDTAAEFEKLLRWHDEDAKAIEAATRLRGDLRSRIATLEADREESDREYEAATARIADLEAERHTTNEAVSDAAEQLRRQRDRIDVLEKAAVEGRAALASFCADHQDPGTAALGALYLLQQATFGTPMQPGETVPKSYRASHDSIPMGLYLTSAEARKHCEEEERRAWAKFDFDWIEDEEDGVAELVVMTADGEVETGYMVTALEIAAEYDSEADQ
ncbi:hypothetical protein ACWHA6_37935 [Streptomyces anthocyanicus]|uniref:hypothetical protein n=1 Tax=Streptomyces anthocyanicus TaxID=68174 RepID=UPI00364E30B5